MQFEKRNFRVAPIVLTCYFPAVNEQFGNLLRTLNPPKKNQEKYANLVFRADTTAFSVSPFLYGWCTTIPKLGGHTVMR